MKHPYYEVLEISALASQAEAKRAFRSLAQTHHPDHGGDEQKFKDIQAALEEALRVAPLHRVSAHGRSSHKTQASPTAAPPPNLTYDPFEDPAYGTYQFFVPEVAKLEGFERSLFSDNCLHCHGSGVITKLVKPERGFAGLETRLCICQKVGIK